MIRWRYVWLMCILGCCANCATTGMSATPMSSQNAVKEVSVPIVVPQSGSTLQGTLFVPGNWSRPLPGVVIAPTIEASANHRAMGRTIAQSLARSGIVVLVYDPPQITSGRDAAAKENEQLSVLGAAWDALKRRYEVALCVLGVMGHGEGARVAARFASTERQVSALALASARGRSGWTLLRERVRADVLDPNQITDPLEVATHLKYVEDALPVISQGGAFPESRSYIHPALKTWLTQTIQGPEGAKIQDDLAHDPAEPVRKLRMPVLILSGTADPKTNAADFDALRLAANHAQAYRIETMGYWLESSTGSSTESGSPIHPQAQQRIVEFFRSALYLTSDRCHASH